MKPFRVGIIGIGDISDVYFDNLKNYEIVRVDACSARSLEKAQKKAAKHGVPKAYASTAELLADPDIDIVLNLTVPAVHAEITLQALAAGKHVYTEKPLATTVEDGQAILRRAKETGLMVGCAPDTFLGGRLQTCRRLIDDGTIGDVTAASAFVVFHGPEWFHPNPDFYFKADVGPLPDIGPYYVTALLSLLGPVKRVCAMSKRTFAKRTIESAPRRGQTIDVDVDTHITANLEFASGALVTLIASFDVWDSELPRMELYGTRGTLCLRDVDPLDGPNLFGGPLLLKTRDTARFLTMPRKQPVTDWETVPVQHRFNETSHEKNSRGIGLVDMAYAIQNGRPNRASAEMAFHAVELTHAILTAAQEKRYVELHSTFPLPAPLPVDFPDSEP